MGVRPCPPKACSSPDVRSPQIQSRLQVGLGGQMSLRARRPGGPESSMTRGRRLRAQRQRQVLWPLPGRVSAEPRHKQPAHTRPSAAGPRLWPLVTAVLDTRPGPDSEPQHLTFQCGTERAAAWRQGMPTSGSSVRLEALRPSRARRAAAQPPWSRQCGRRRARSPDQWTAPGVPKRASVYGREI